MKRMKNTIKNCVTSLEDFIHFCLVTQETFENNNNKKISMVFSRMYTSTPIIMRHTTRDRVSCVVFFSHHISIILPYHYSITLINNGQSLHS